jgi:DNA-binding MarR family transcriptional regulator
VITINNERVSVLEITPKGRNVLRNISPEKDENIGKNLSIYSDDPKFQLLLMIKKIIKHQQCPNVNRIKSIGYTVPPLILGVE